jgi:hypothetical protein
MGIQIPKFDAEDYVVGTEEEFVTEMNKSSKSRPIKEPGLYTLTIDDIAIHAQTAKGDPNWMTVLFMLKNEKNETIRHYQNMPLKRVNNFQYGKKKTYFVYKQLCEFLKSLGIELAFETAMSTLGGLYADSLNALLNQKLEAYIGYNGAYTRYLGKNGENNEYCIMHNGEQLVDEDGGSLIFADYKAAENYAAGIKLPIEGFPNIQSFTPTTQSVIVEDTIDDDDDLPL